MLKFILSLIFILQTVSYNTYQTKIVNTPIFYSIKHHIVLATKNKENDKMKKDVYIFDYSPNSKLNPFSLLKLVIGCSVPSEIRIIHFPELNDDTTLIDNWYKKTKLPHDFRKVLRNINDDNMDKIIKYCYNKPFNLYTNNCQHFSKYFVSNINNNNTKNK